MPPTWLITIGCLRTTEVVSEPERSRYAAELAG
jgi:hypothetical protein